MVILGHLICFFHLHFLYNSKTHVFFFLSSLSIENSLVTIWGQSAGAGSVMFHVSYTFLKELEILKLNHLRSSSPMVGMTKVSFEQLWQIVRPSAIRRRLILHT